MDSIKKAKQTIRTAIAGSAVPEDRRHAENTLKWLLMFEPDAGQALQIAALAHDIDRAVEAEKTKRSEYDDYDVFKAAHAQGSAMILKKILSDCRLPAETAKEACRLVTLHEVGGDPRSDLLRNADSISFFEVNMPLYCQREGRKETIRRCIWGLRRLSEQMKSIVKTMTYKDEALTRLLQDAIRQAG
jgi:hypothetical protein